MGELFCLLLF